jgi:acyl dehydratase
VDTPFEPWTVVAQNLPEHAGNAIHTDEGARAAGFPAALVAGVTTYAYLTHPVLAVWGRRWLAEGGATVRFRSPVFAGEAITCAPGTVDGSPAVLAVGPDESVRATLAVQGPGDDPASPTAVPEGWETDRSVLPLVRLRLEGEYGSDYGERAGDDLDVCRRLGVAHPAVWPALANHVVHRYVARGPWIHTGSVVRHHGLAPAGQVAEVAAAVRARQQRKGREHALLDVTIAVGGRAVATLEHQAIVHLPG